MATRSGSVLRISLVATTTGTAGLNGVAAQHDTIFEAVQAAGTGSGQTDKVYSATGTAISTTPVDIDLAGGAADPATGANQTFTVLTGILIRNTGATTIRVGGDANSVPFLGATNDLVLVPAGGALCWFGGASGVTVTAGTGDIIQIDTASSTSTADIVIWGR